VTWAWQPDCMVEGRMYWCDTFHNGKKDYARFPRKVLGPKPLCLVALLLECVCVGSVYNVSQAGTALVLHQEELAVVDAYIFAAIPQWWEAWADSDQTAQPKCDVYRASYFKFLRTCEQFHSHTSDVVQQYLLCVIIDEQIVSYLLVGPVNQPSLHANMHYL